MSGTSISPELVSTFAHLDRASPARPNQRARERRLAAGVQLSDFHAYLPAHNYIFAPTGELWPMASVNACLPPVPSGESTLKPSSWLDQFRSVEQMTWVPGEPMIVDGRLVSGGGWIERPGCRIFNLYRPPTLAHGDPALAGPWVDHVVRIFADDASHLIAWLAHRVQCPQVKINHALVLGGAQGIGKDTILEPVRYAIGPWNFSDVSPAQLLGRFNGFVKSVILRISEARDLGEVDRYAFYDHLKTYTAAPPDVIRVDEKNLREYMAWNVTGVVVTTNHRTDGLYLPPDDRRHFVAWSDCTREAFSPEYWTTLYRWYQSGGYGHVAAYLAAYDLSDFDPKAPPRKTPAFWSIVDANRAPEDADLADALERLGDPAAVTLDEIASRSEPSFGEWLRDKKNARQVPHRLEAAGYVAVRNAHAKDGLWRVNGRRQVVYTRHGLSLRDRLAAATNVGARQ